ncbi:polysaccharide lyase family protein [Pontibacter sp. E15-1]|uniref:polysaccharide lyase family protein n=1 Tax=Pontibacter sp. E15-1 TaxID=2919918 RepID=UPI001F4F34E9|nr:polysaccharide lyase family protein [Pontibacter sp. E15-1]MCJ8163892.1 polysaccharide lyase family protein [Pontibacter sp. E15-1]
MKNLLQRVKKNNKWAGRVGIAMLLSLFSTQAFSQTADWVGSVSTDYFDVANWSQPVDFANISSTTLVIRPGAPHYPVHSGGSATTNSRPDRVNIAPDGNLTVNGTLYPWNNDYINGTLTVNAPADLNMRRDMYVATEANTNATITINGGSVSTKYAVRASTGAASHTTLTVAGGALWVGTDLALATTEGTTADLNVSGGTANILGRLYVGAGGKIHISALGMLKVAGDQRTQLNDLVTAGQLTVQAGKTLDISFDGTNTAAAIYQDPNSMIREYANEVVLSNGVLTARIDKATSNITSLKLNDVEQLNVLGDRRKGTYYDFQTSYGFETMYNCVYSVKVENENMVDISFKRTYNPATGQVTPADADIHYVLHKNDTGLYSYSILEHKPEYPAFDLGSWRMVQWINHDGSDYLTERIYVDELRNWEMPSVTDFNNAEATPIQEIVKLTTGVRAGKYDGKYEYTAPFWGEGAGVYGHASNKNNIGTWIIMPNPEYLNGGPTHQDLIAAAGINHVLLNGLHYGDKAFVIPQGEQWSKMYGPFLMYSSAKATGDENWADAKQRAKEEEAKWPYAWLTDVPEYPLADARGGVSGKFMITDPAKPALTGADAWVGVTKISNADNQWQHEAKNYHYWVKTNADGSFTIPNVRPGTYSFYAYTDGAVGEYAIPDVTVTAGGDNNLGDVTWNIARANGKILWEVGVPNRKSDEFKLGAFDYAEGFVERKFRDTFPGVIEYNTQANNWADVLPYAHTKYPTEEFAPGDGWKWRFNFTMPANMPTEGDAKLTIAYASTDHAQQWIYVNDESRTFKTYYPDNGDGNAFIRQANYAKYSTKEILIPMDKLVPGENTITLLMPSNSGWVSHHMYDYISLEASVPPLAATVAATDVTCHGASDGKITFTLNGGAPAYQVKVGAAGTYTMHASPYTLENMAAGTYTVYVKDASGEEVTSTVTINAPAAIALSTSKEDVKGNNQDNGSITATFSDGTAPYQVKLGADGTLSTQASPYTFSGLVAGTYAVHIVDANGCEVVESVEVAQSVVTGVKGPHAGTQAHIFPNPSNSSFTLQVQGRFSYQIHGATTAKVVEKGHGLNETQVGEALAPGYYYIRVEGKGKPFYIKLLKN